MCRYPTCHVAILSLVLALQALAVGSNVQAQTIKQMPLTDAQVKGFIAAQADLEPLVVNLSEGADEPNEKLKNDLDKVAKKHGFADFGEYLNVNDNIAYVMGGLNSKTLEFTEPVERLKADLEMIKADKEIPAEEKKFAIEDLTQELKSMERVKHKGNIEVVKQNFAELLKLLPEDDVLRGEGDAEKDDADEKETKD